MRLHEFIIRHNEQILVAWEKFARSVETPIPSMNAEELRDHAERILMTAAQDMQTFQTQGQQIAKSHGDGPQSVTDSPAQTHAMTRFVAGFSMDQMVSEFRALRSSVLRLWLSENRVEDEHDIQDMIRFNEAIDQALVESIATFEKAVDTTRKMVLGVLGHDLRSPMGAVMMASDLLRERASLTDRDKKLASQISASIRRANLMVGDLLDLTRCNLGSGIPINRENSDLGNICVSVVEELCTWFPHAQINVNLSEAVTGMYDPKRLEQVFTNLISNAIRHGDSEQPIHVTLSQKNNCSIFTVQNRGELIPSSVMPLLFNPQGRYSNYAATEKGLSAGLGLGLFIVAEIVTAHGGAVEVVSTVEQGTVFKVLLPIT
ncbi:sensor histidine kinase [Pseudomonas sp. MYb118]|uniref:sensor histidine kinase n=1 Tax=Pseudomonas sp. MYb118 TaxID=1848720 RepID=UPI0034CFAC16